MLREFTTLEKALDPLRRLFRKFFLGERAIQSAPLLSLGHEWSCPETKEKNMREDRSAYVDFPTIFQNASSSQDVVLPD